MATGVLPHLQDLHPGWPTSTVRVELSIAIKYHGNPLETWRNAMDKHGGIHSEWQTNALGLLDNGLHSATCFVEGYMIRDQYTVGSRSSNEPIYHWKHGREVTQMNGSSMGEEDASSLKQGMPTWPARGMYVYYSGTRYMCQQRMTKRSEPFPTHIWNSTQDPQKTTVSRAVFKWKGITNQYAVMICDVLELNVWKWRQPKCAHQWSPTSEHAWSGQDQVHPSMMILLL